MTWKFPGLSRRSFLAASAGGAAAAATGATVPLALGTGRASDDTDDEARISYTICNFCSSLCNVRVTTRVRNGAAWIVKLDGNPHSTLNRGKICARGQAGLRQTYDSDRIKTPLIRVEGSKRGEYAFRSATWEEAWTYIGERLKQEKIQPWEWTMVGGWTSCVFYMNWAVPFALANQIPNIIASPMQHCVTTGHLGTDAVTGNFNVHDEILPDYDHARYILLIGNNASIGAVSTSRMVRMAAARKQGARLVVLDPRRSETAAKADEWIAIRPGTDLDFCLAMLHVMLEDGLYDEQFLQRHSNMPFLLHRDDAGEWALALDPEGRPQVIAEGDSEPRALPAFGNDNRVDVNGNHAYPRLAVPENSTAQGRPVVTVFQAQRRELDGYSVYWAERSTGVPAETIRRIAHEFGRNRPAIIDPGWHGARYGNVMMLRRVQAMIQGLIGGIDQRGGWVMSGEYHHKAHAMLEAMQHGDPGGPPLATLAGLPFAKMVIDAVSNPEHFEHGKPGFAWAFSQQERAAGRDWVMLPAMADCGLKESVTGRLTYEGEPYRTRALLINAANPVRHYYPDTYWKDILTHDDMALVVVVDVLPSDTTPYADVILPNSTYLERDEPTVYGNGVNQDLALTTRYAAIEPLYDTEESPDILYHLTEIISGNTKGFVDAVEQLTGLPARPVREAFARTRAERARGAFSAACREVAFVEAAKRVRVTPEELDHALRSRGVYHEEDWETLLETTAMPRVMPMPTGSGRLEFFSTLFADLREKGGEGPHFSPLATHIPAACRDGTRPEAPLDDDEFFFTYGKTPTVSYGSTNSNNPVLAAINRFKRDIYAGVWMHPDRAARLGIATGDPILLTNVRSGQRADGVAYVTRLVHRDTLFLHSSFGVENPALTRSAGIGTATNKLIPYEVEPVVAGFRSQEFTIRVARVGKGAVT